MSKRWFNQVTGITKAKRRFARATGIPTTRGGRRAKANRFTNMLVGYFILFVLAASCLNGLFGCHKSGSDKNSKSDGKLPTPDKIAAEKAYQEIYKLWENESIAKKKRTTAETNEWVEKLIKYGDVEEKPTTRFAYYQFAASEASKAANRRLVDTALSRLDNTFFDKPSDRIFSILAKQFMVWSVDEDETIAFLGEAVDRENQPEAKKELQGFLSAATSLRNRMVVSIADFRTAFGRAQQYYQSHSIQERQEKAWPSADELDRPPESRYAYMALIAIDYAKMGDYHGLLNALKRIERSIKNYDHAWYLPEAAYYFHDRDPSKTLEIVRMGLRACPRNPPDGGTMRDALIDKERLLLSNR